VTSRKWLGTSGRDAYPMVEQRKDSWRRSASGFVGISLENSRLFGKLSRKNALDIRLSGRDRYLVKVVGDDHQPIRPIKLSIGRSIGENHPLVFPFSLTLGCKSIKTNVLLR
jgi:hypothetical protein